MHADARRGPDDELCVKFLQKKLFSAFSHLKVGVNVISVPVQGVVLHLEVVTGKVT